MYSKRGAKSNYAILLYMLKCEYTLQTTLLQTTFNFQCTYTTTVKKAANPERIQFTSQQGLIT